jgi:putative Ca2+/H+ antiporter (TMEM165/GDT1 family)
MVISFQWEINILTFHLQKPMDLPEKPHDIPHPLPKGSSKPDGKEPPAKYPSSHDSDEFEDSNGAAVIQPFHSYILAMSMILVSEIGDKTFLVAALMAMRHPRILVFSAASAALIVMTVLSAVLGHAVPTLIPERLTHFAAAILFLIFGVKLMREGLAMSPDEGVGEEMKEVEMELEEKEHHMARRNSRQISPYTLEAGQAPKSSRGRRSRSDSRLPAPPRSPSSSPSSRSLSPNRTSVAAVIEGISNLFSLLLSPVWVQTFVMTFLAEWGDRSQIATIAMAAGQDYWWVTGGAISGHAVCTFVAVMGGRAIAGRISARVGKFYSFPRLCFGSDANYLQLHSVVLLRLWCLGLFIWRRLLPTHERHLCRKKKMLLL